MDNPNNLLDDFQEIGKQEAEPITAEEYKRRLKKELKILSFARVPLFLGWMCLYLIAVCFYEMEHLFQVWNEVYHFCNSEYYRFGFLCFAAASIHVYMMFFFLILSFSFSSTRDYVKPRLRFWNFKMNDFVYFIFPFLFILLGVLMPVVYAIMIGLLFYIVPFGYDITLFIVLGGYIKYSHFYFKDFVENYYREKIEQKNA